MNSMRDCMNALQAMAAACDREIPEFLYSVYMAAFERIGPDAAYRALNDLMMTLTAGSRLPLPADVLKACGTEPPSQRSLAVEAADQIWRAIERCGYNNQSAARAMLSDVAWSVVERCGGWQSVCQVDSYKEMTILKAQWRDSAVSVIERETYENARLGSGGNVLSLGLPDAGLMKRSG